MRGPPFTDVRGLDAELAVLAREEGAVRFELGRALEALAPEGAAALGFSSLGAYVMQRCQRSVRWGEAARWMARRLALLPAVRAALRRGDIGWSHAELLARHVTATDEVEWLGRAQRQSLRALAEALERGTSDDAGGGGGEAESCLLTITLRREEAWLFEATRLLVEGLGGAHAGWGINPTDTVVRALLAEGESSLCQLVVGALDDRGHAADDDYGRWRAEWQRVAEVQCEERIGRGWGELGGARALPVERDLSRATVAELDAVVVELAARLGRRDAEFGQRALRLHRADGWRRLGYASEAQYARERLGMSRSAFKARRALALRLEGLPVAAAAFAEGALGVEAARLIARVATAATDAAWVERACCRTVKHLAEEVEAAGAVLRLTGRDDCWPPTADELALYLDIERAVLGGHAMLDAALSPFGGVAALGVAMAPVLAPTGQAVANDTPTLEGAGGAGSTADLPGRWAWSRGLGALLGWLLGGNSASLRAGAVAAQCAGSSGVVSAGAMSGTAESGAGVQISAGPPAGVAGLAGSAGDAGRRRAADAQGKVRYRLRVARETYHQYRQLEANLAGWLPRGHSLLAVLCGVFWSAWRHLLGAPRAYGGVYLRDRYRCSCPVCRRRDVTPHHVVFRGAGGSDEAENVTALCVHCHLDGVHAGWLRVTGRAPELRWELAGGRLIVEGRELSVAS